MYHYLAGDHGLAFKLTDGHGLNCTSVIKLGNHFSLHLFISENNRLGTACFK